MFERYVVQSKEYADLPVPKGAVKVGISENGQVQREDRKPVKYGYDRQGNLAWELDLWNGVEYYSVALLLLVAYQKLRLPTEYFDRVETFFIDGNPTNFHVSNIGYRYTVPIECKTKPGFYHIPYFSRYVISPDKNVWNIHDNKAVKYYITKKRNTRAEGYRYYGITSDTGKFNIGRHRLMGLTFLPYPDHVDNLVVNHINGVPGDDRLENLEWTTYSENNIHAVKAGLRTQNQYCHCKNVFTGEELSFASVGIAARHFNLPIMTLNRRANSPGQNLYEGGWLYKKDKNIPWREVKDPYGELKRNSNPNKVWSKNVFTGEIREHVSASQCGIDLKLKEVNAPRRQISKGYTRPYCGYLFKTEYDKTPWPEFTERELAVFRDNPMAHARGVIAKNEKGEELFFTNIINAAKYFQHILKSKNDVIKAIARLRNVDGYRLSYL